MTRAQALPLRRGWRAAFGDALVLGLAATAVWAALRGVALLGPRAAAPLLPLGFVLMALLPLLALPRAAWARIGWQRAHHGGWYAVALATGVALASAVALLGNALFGAGPDHWFASIAAYYRRQLDSTGFDLLRLHLSFTLPALLFSPVAEELFFRGYLQAAFETRWSVRTSTVFEAALFALIHLFHHGLWIDAGHLALRSVSGAVWVVLMFATALALAALRRASGSLGPAIVAHAAFNAAMNGWIFSTLWSAA